jgi:hypothetical protein
MTSLGNKTTLIQFKTSALQARRDPINNAFSQLAFIPPRRKRGTLTTAGQTAPHRLLPIMDDTFGSDAFGDFDDEELISLTIAAEKQHESESRQQQSQSAVLQKAGVTRTPKTPKLPMQPQEEENYDDLLEGAFESDDLDMSFLSQTPARTRTPRMPPPSSGPQRQIMSSQAKGQRTLPSNFNRTPSSGNLRQLTLFGGRVVENPSSSLGSGANSQAFPLTEVPMNPYEKPTHHRLDEEAIKTWVYPTNMAQRDYQFNIVKKALLTNTLVALPTGLFSLNHSTLKHVDEHRSWKDIYRRSSNAQFLPLGARLPNSLSRPHQTAGRATDPCLLRHLRHAEEPNRRHDRPRPYQNPRRTLGG